MTSEISRLGGKGNGLVGLTQNTDLGFSVPEFEVIETPLHEDYLKQFELAKIVAMIQTRATGQPHFGRVLRAPRSVEEKCEELACKFNGRPVAVRSSGVISEDSGKHSGAGIYDTFILEANQLTPQTLLEKVLGVYASVNSPRAVKYRQQTGLDEERMAVVVQEFIEPDWSGVMYTSNPSYSADLAIEFIRGRNAVVDGAKGTFIIDFDKRTKKPVFKSENIDEHDYRRVKGIDLDRLVRIGVQLERRTFPSDIEFAVKDGEVYLLQQRQITDLEKPQRVTLPKKYSDKVELIGVANIKRGNGIVRFPAIKLEEIGDVHDRIGILATLDPERAHQMIRDYFDNLMDADKRYKDGYVLVTPHFSDTIMPSFSLLLPHIKVVPTIDNLTPHKKAVITTRYPNISSHIMTIARERGIPYASFEHSEELFEDVRTGDNLAIYFSGRKAHVFREKTPPKSIRELHPDLSFVVEEWEGGSISARSSKYLDSDRPYTNDFLLFLNQTTGRNWTFEGFNGVMGGTYTDEKNRQIVMQMSQMSGQYHQLSFPDSKWMRHCGYKPVAPKERQKIMQDYKKHLTE